MYTAEDVLAMPGAQLRDLIDDLIGNRDDMHTLLSWLSGYAPEAMARALNRVADARKPAPEPASAAA